MGNTEAASETAYCVYNVVSQYCRDLFNWVCWVTIFLCDVTIHKIRQAWGKQKEQ